MTSAEGLSVWVGDISSNVAPRLGWELRGAGGSVEKAGMGFGATLDPDLTWRSLRVGLDCCLSLIAEKWTIHHCVLVHFWQDAQLWPKCTVRHVNHSEKRGDQSLSLSGYIWWHILQNSPFTYSRLWWLIPWITSENGTNRARQKSNAFDTHVYHSTPSRQT